MYASKNYGQLQPTAGAKVTAGIEANRGVGLAIDFEYFEPFNLVNVIRTDTVIR